MKGFILAAPASGSGKTVIMLALLRRLAQSGVRAQAAKAGPDYIDADFHRFALARGERRAGDEDEMPSFNLDSWAMRPALLRALAEQAAQSGKMLCVEAMMGLYDGAAGGGGSAADLARFLRLPVILAIDCSKFSHSVAALVQGFCAFDKRIRIIGLVLNKTGSARHEEMLRAALKAAGAPPVLAVLRRDAGLRLPERHLGLVQAAEQSNLEGFIRRAAEQIALAADWRQILAAGAAGGSLPLKKADALPLSLPLRGRHIAIARDNAFRFVYPHHITAWRQAGRRLSFFSPLNDEAPANGADCAFLPGGYPELYAARLSGARNFRRAMRAFAAQGGAVYGECGGYMALGRALRDAKGISHEMLGLLPIETDFQNSRLALGYRRLIGQNSAWAGGGRAFRGHEFHYAGFAADEAAALRADKSGRLKPLWQACDSQGANFGAAGLALGSVSGSFIHIIDCEA